MIAQGSSQGGTHANIHAPVSAYHDKDNVSGRNFSLFLLPVTDLRKAA